MFRIMQTSVVVAITLIMVNESQAGRPGTSSGNGSSHPKVSPTVGSNKTIPPITTVYGPITKNTGAFGNNKVPPITTVYGPKDPVHGTGSSHDPRSPSQTHGRDYCNWGHHCWNSRYGCENYWSLADGCYFYFYAPANCYYPISVIELFPPVCPPVALVNPVAAVPVAAVASR